MAGGGVGAALGGGAEVTAGNRAASSAGGVVTAPAGGRRDGDVCPLFPLLGTTTEGPSALAVGVAAPGAGVGRRFAVVAGGAVGAGTPTDAGGFGDAAPDHGLVTASSTASASTATPAPASSGILMPRLNGGGVAGRRAVAGSTGILTRLDRAGVGVPVAGTPPAVAAAR